MNVNKNHKSSVFSLLFGNPDILRELYSAIEGVELPPDIPIDINTLSDVLYKGKINDLSFLIDNRLIVLIEHQSTINENMPIRLLIYVSDVYKRIINRRDMFLEKLVKIPMPEFIVLYNGNKPYDDYKELKLSDAFKDIEGLKVDKSTIDKSPPPLELTAKVYNINKGHNPQMLEKSKTLEGYSIFIGKIKELKANNLSLDESIRSAVRYCLENDVLTDFLRAHEGEVVDMILEDLTMDEWMDLRYEEGLEQGMQENSKQVARNSLEAGLPIEVIQKITGLSTETIQSL
ncbi:MAG: Rpn family recombination-promoting nuclease/putative transposase [Treponema sp.]|nr:Rpn family recombination-promoting nuclease/putative transposase [Treponema sp.]